MVGGSVYPLVKLWGAAAVDKLHPNKPEQIVNVTLPINRSCPWSWLPLAGLFLTSRLCRLVYSYTRECDLLQAHWHTEEPANLHHDASDSDDEALLPQPLCSKNISNTIGEHDGGWMRYTIGRAVILRLKPG